MKGMGNVPDYSIVIGNDMILFRVHMGRFVSFDHDDDVIKMLA